MAPINQQEIANRLNISRTTVSRCFTNHKGINPNTRAHVFSLAAKLGYQYLQPRSTARSATKTRSIGVLICGDAELASRADHNNPGAEMLPGISEFAQLNQWHTDVHFVSPLARSLSDPAYTAIHGLKKRLWSGLLLVRRFPPAIIAELSARFPCVSLEEQYVATPVDSVDTNHYRGISALLDRLLQLGHTRIGFFSRQSLPDAVWTRHRLSAYVENSLRHNLTFHPEDVIQLDAASPETKAEDYDRVVQQTRVGVTAWMCASDRLGYELIGALTERGLNVPSDVSVTGFDGIPRPEGAPALDTVRIPYYEIGFAGARRLLDKIDKRYESQQDIQIECRVQDGETVGRPRTGLK